MKRRRKYMEQLQFQHPMTSSLIQMMTIYFTLYHMYYAHERVSLNVQTH